MKGCVFCGSVYSGDVHTCSYCGEYKGMVETNSDQWKEFQEVLKEDDPDRMEQVVEKQRNHKFEVFGPVTLQ